MVTRARFFSSPVTRYRLGNALVTLGVLTWLPFIVLRIAGEKPSLFLFLPFHLAGVIGGSRLRSLARREMSTVAPKKNRLRLVGHGLVYAGVAVWLPYFYLKLLTPTPVNVMDFLPFHLTGVLGGVTLLTISYFMARREERAAD